MCPKCQTRKMLRGKDTCFKCREKKTVVGVCVGCGQEKRIKTAGRCSCCANKHYGVSTAMRVVVTECQGGCQRRVRCDYKNHTLCGSCFYRDLDHKPCQGCSKNVKKLYSGLCLACAGHNRRKKYGLRREDFARMHDDQGGRCAICARDFKDNSDTCVDHCHASGKVRALLCRRCNRGIGLFRDHAPTIELAAAYLKAHDPLGFSMGGGT